jgi:methylenetetrahydrofolate dehydrogenase (NADP+)/methenyltetrahydrofolate cyclohydrolase
MARILDGRVAATALRQRLRGRVDALRGAGVVPHLVLIQVGEDPASTIYVRSKEKGCAELGIRSRTLHPAADIGQSALRDEIRGLNRDPAVHGILLQLPLPDGLEEDPLLAEIDPTKDVDGFHPLNVGRLCLGLPGFVPATPLGIVRLLQHHAVPVEGRRVVILGRSRLVGRPLANLLSSRGPVGNATVTLCHTQTRDLPAVAREAEILIAAVGQPRFVTREMVAAGAVVVDVGVHRVPDPARPGATKLCGDVDFDAVAPQAAAISPVPGGVGLMTVACLLENTVSAAERAVGIST